MSDKEEDVEHGVPTKTTSKGISPLLVGILGFIAGALIVGLSVGLTKPTMMSVEMEEELEEEILSLETELAEKTLGNVYMQEMIKVTDYDNSEGSLHFDPEPTWGNDVEASRKFRTLESGGAYSYRNKVRRRLSLLFISWMLRNNLINCTTHIIS